MSDKYSVQTDSEHLLRFSLSTHFNRFYLIFGNIQVLDTNREIERITFHEAFREIIDELIFVLFSEHHENQVLNF